MATISEIQVSYMRRVQINQFEPAEAMIGLKIHLAEDESADTVAKQAIFECKNIVNTALKEGVTVETKATVMESKNVDKPVQKAKKAATSKKKAAVDTTSAEPSDDTDEAPAKAKSEKKETPADDLGGFPDDEEEEEPSGTRTISQNDVTNEISRLVKDKLTTAAKVKTLLKEFNALRTSDLEPEQRQEFLDKLKAGVK